MKYKTYKISNYFKCKICGESVNSRTMAMHLRWNHGGMKTKEYVEKYGQFVEEKIKNEKLKQKNNVNCEICNERLNSHRHLIWHIRIKHPETTWEKYFIKYFFNGIHPTCNCGCGQKVNLIRGGKNDKGEKSYAREFVKNHAWRNNILPGWIEHSDKTKRKQRLSAIERIKRGKKYYHNEFSTSKREKELIQWIKKNYKGNNIIEGDRNILAGQELDIYFPELNLAIEFNGTYYHSAEFKDKKYHVKKTEECEKQGIQLLHIWDSDWIRKKNIIKSIILNKLNLTENKIYARKTTVKEITRSISMNFLNENHLQGNTLAKIRLGLYDNNSNELISVMTFGKRRNYLRQKGSLNDYELLRFANKINYSVIGGASKLFKYFVRTYKPKSILSYANRDISNGNLYEKLGFNYISSTTPGYHWYKSKIKYNRYNFRKDKLVKEGFDPNKTEYEIMRERGFYKVWNSGNLKYEF